jgi:hypothetical protein
LKFKRTPAIEASLIYGVALILGFLLYAAAAGWGNATQISRLMALLLQLPTWVLMVLVSFLMKRSTKFSRFFGNVSVMSVMTIVFILLFNSATAQTANGEQYSGMGYLVALVFFISTLVGSVLTQFVFFRNIVEPKPIPKQGVAKSPKGNK